MSEGSLFLGEYPTIRLQTLEPWSSLPALQEAEHLFQAAQWISLFQAAWLVLTTYMSFVEEGLLSLKLAWEEMYTTCKAISLAHSNMFVVVVSIAMVLGELSGLGGHRESGQPSGPQNSTTSA